MRTQELRSLPSEELTTRLDETREELFNLRFQNATGQLENYKRLGLLKRELARLQTVLKERDLGIEVEVQDEPKKRWRKDADSEEETERRPRRRKKAEQEGEGDDVAASAEDDELEDVAASTEDDEPEIVEDDDDADASEGSK